MWRLAVIATVAGAFSGLFGVGGGGVMVALLVLWSGYREREATGTSLAAIPIIAMLGAVAQGLSGNVDLPKGLLMGLPAVGGVLVGTWLQQQVSPRWVSVVLAVVLVASALLLIF
jgi:uncharacterized protein